MSLATTLLAFALAGGSASRVTAPPAQHGMGPVRIEATAPCAAPAQTGIFRIIAMRPDSTGTRPGMIMLENVDGCLEATLVTDEASPAVIDHLEFAGDTLTGTVRTGAGDARVSLSFGTKGVTGSIVSGRELWLVRGRKTA